ncbi:hypothetical protein PG995_012146 [Apiospora arundinis]
MTGITPKVFASLQRPRYRRFNYLEWEPDNEIEELEQYEPGGFCPIDLSLRDEPKFINDRFQVIYKLGFGGFGTVWLCYDLVTKRWRALKVHQARHSSPTHLTEDRGDRLVNQTMERDGISTEEALANGVVLPLETFWIDSPNGRHMCTVLPLLGPRLTDLMDHMPGDDPGRIKHISYQTAQSMNFLHQHGLCHGDFRPRNVLLKLRDGCFDSISVEEMRQLLERPAMIDIELQNGERSPHAPELAVSCIEWDKLWEYVTDDVAIVDFGETYTTTNPNPPDLGIPRRYAAPEILVGGDKGMATDLWALGCTLLDLRCRGLPHTLPHTLELVKTMESWMGPCPPPFRLHVLQQLYERDLETWRRRGGQEDMSIPKPEPPGSSEAFQMQPLTYITQTDPYDTDGNKIGDRKGSIEYYLGRQHSGGFVRTGEFEETLTDFRLTEEEIACFSDLLHKMLRWQPKQRWNTTQVMGHAWFGTRSSS